MGCHGDLVCVCVSNLQCPASRGPQFHASVFRQLGWEGVQAHHIVGDQKSSETSLTSPENIGLLWMLCQLLRHTTTSRYTAHSSPCNIVSFWLRSNLSKLRLQGDKESAVCPSCKMRRDSGEFLAFLNLTGTLLSEAHFSSPQLSCQGFVPHVKWPKQWGIYCVPESHWHAQFSSPQLSCVKDCAMFKTAGCLGTA